MTYEAIMCKFRGSEAMIQHELYHCLRGYGFGVVPFVCYPFGIPDLTIFDNSEDLREIVCFVECKKRGVDVPPEQLARYTSIGVQLFICNQFSQVQELASVILAYSEKSPRLPLKKVFKL